MTGLPPSTAAEFAVFQHKRCYYQHIFYAAPANVYNAGQPRFHTAPCWLDQLSVLVYSILVPPGLALRAPRGFGSGPGYGLISSIPVSSVTPVSSVLVHYRSLTS